MKLLTKWGAGALLLCGAIALTLVLTHAKVIPNGSLATTKYTSIELKQMASLGLLHSKPLNLSDYDEGVNPETVASWKEKTGLRYYSEVGLDRILQANELMLASMPDYTGDVPKAAIQAITEGIEKYKASTPQTDYMLVVDGQYSTGLTAAQIDARGLELIKTFGRSGPDHIIQHSASQNWLIIANAYSEILPFNRNAIPIVLRIAAGKDNLDLEGKHVVGNRAFNGHDPEVFLQVPGGWLLLASW